MIHVRMMRHSALSAVAALALSSAACIQPTGCPPPEVRAAATPTPTSDTAYAGTEDPYSRGSLAIERTSIAACQYGTPVPLLIFAPATVGNYPVVVFQHGFMSRNEAYSEILSHLASHGFVVVAPQMYEPGLAALLGKPSAAEEAQSAAQVLRRLPDGLPEILGYSPNFSRIGLAGHSRGGKVSWLVLVADSSLAQAIAGVDPVDGAGGPAGNQARVVQGPFEFSLPALVVGAERGGDCAPEGDNHEQFYAASRSPAWHIVIPDAGHADMLDEAVASAAARLCPGRPDRATVRRLTAGVLVAFFRGSLQGDATAYDYLSDAAASEPMDVESK